jgi:hypothetical protein
MTAAGCHVRDGRGWWNTIEDFDRMFTGIAKVRSWNIQRDI